MLHFHLATCVHVRAHCDTYTHTRTLTHAQAALALHDKVSSTFRKTAINFHYEFTVRHLANVFQVCGMLARAQTRVPALTRLVDVHFTAWRHDSCVIHALVPSTKS